jgi:CBS domain-containing protein
MASPTVHASRLSLHADVAAGLMEPNPVSIRENATVDEAIAFLVDKGLRAAPVINDAGRPVGVVSGTDILAHDREKARGAPSATRDSALVRDIMTPVLFSVAPDTPAARVVAEMVSLQINRLFVVDGDGSLVGVISALDILRRLR